MGTVGGVVQSAINARNNLFETSIGIVSQLIALAQQPLDISRHFLTALDLVGQLPLTETQRSSVVRGLRKAERMQTHQEFGAARHELGLVRRNLIRQQEEISEKDTAR